MTSVWSTLDADAVKEGIKKCVTCLRTLIQLECRAMQRATLATNIAKKRASLETGKRGIQKAMGRGVANARMTSLETTHPSVVRVELGKWREEVVRVACLEGDPKCKLRSSSGTLTCTPSQLQCVCDVLCSLERLGVKPSIGSGKCYVDELVCLRAFYGH